MRALHSSLLIAGVGLSLAATPAWSQDSEAPPGAPRHWLPREPWVMRHWLPYDERELYRLLGVDRGDVWRELSADTGSLERLATERGWSPRELADALVAPWAPSVADRRQVRRLRSRALRTITQGHLAQHLFFHSFHQDVIPRAVHDIFGVASRARFDELRRDENSPLQICRLQGLPRRHAAQRVAAHLRRAALRGIERSQTPRTQAMRLLSRQLGAVPRWLRQGRRLGPMPLLARTSPARLPGGAFGTAVMSADGRQVVDEGLDSGLGSPAYDPAVSADGRWIAIESPRRDIMRVVLRDAARRVSVPLSGRRASAFNPTISGSGRRVAFEVQRSARGRISTAVVMRHMTVRGASFRVGPSGPPSDAYDPSLSLNGRRIAFAATERGRPGAHSRVYVADTATGASQLVSPAAGEDAWEPALSADGSVVAFTATDRRGGTRVIVRRVATGRAVVVPSPWRSGIAFGAVLSAAGDLVAFVARPAGVRRTQVFVRDLRRGSTRLVSRADGPGGAPAARAAAHPSISADGRRVAFTSSAWNLSRAKCDDGRGAFVRDLERDTTSLASVSAGGSGFEGVFDGPGSAGPAFVAPAGPCSG
jgi:Tol biopolymer transport system component